MLTAERDLLPSLICSVSLMNYFLYCLIVITRCVCGCRSKEMCDTRSTWRWPGFNLVSRTFQPCSLHDRIIIKCVKKLLINNINVNSICEREYTCKIHRVYIKSATDCFHNNFYKYPRISMIFGTQLCKWILIILVNLLRCVPCTSLTWWRNVDVTKNHAVHRARDTVTKL